MEQVKKCTKCGEVKGVGEFSRNGKYMRSHCNKCIKDDAGKYRQTNRKRINEYFRKYTKTNPEKRKELNKKYYEANYEKEIERSKKYREANREKEIERQKKYREANPGKVKEFSKKYYESLPDPVVIRCLQQGTSLTAAEIKGHPELIEIKRLQIQIKRMCEASQE
jgi:hypothetical protein